MSDRIPDISKILSEYVAPEHSRSIGLFPIPEYPEYEEVSGKGMWSSALDVILTTLRYLAPATLLTIFWGQQSFLFRILRHIDLVIKSIVYSSDEQRNSVLKWLEEAGPVKVEHLDTVWRHGWILCRVLDAALPGACAGHPPTRLSLKHAQSIADHYLGVEPGFSRHELETNDSLSKRQEWKLALYLDGIRQALGKLTPPVSKPASQRTSPETPQFTLDYVARGSGLTAAQIKNKIYFKIYPTAQQCLDPGEITVLIRGPKNTYGMTVIQPLLGKAQLIRQNLLGLQSKKTITENALPITQGATYLRAYGKNNMNKTFYIPKAKYDIDIEVETRHDHVRIGYTVPFEGKYEISIKSRAHNIVGSPFEVTASKDIIGALERDSFCLEDGEEIDIFDVETDRKVVLRIVDFVTEKMLLKENGTFEKISKEEADILMSMDSTGTRNDFQKCTAHTMVKIKNKDQKFKDLSMKVKTLKKICNIFNEILKEKQLTKRYNQKVIPDVVNSTFSENNNVKENKRQIIISPSFTMSLPTEMVIANQYDLKAADFIYLDESHNKNLLHSTRSFSPVNPFVDEVNNDIDHHSATEIQTENNDTSSLPIDEIDDTPIKILIETESDCDSPNTNPFIDMDLLNLERPKTPVLKIITGDIHNREDSPFINLHDNYYLTDLNDEMRRSNEFLNPFFMHEQGDALEVQNNDLEDYPTADFKIGAPVSLPPVLKAPSPEPDNMDSIVLASTLDEALYKYEINVQSKKTKDIDCEISTSVFSTPIHNIENINIPNLSDNKLDRIPSISVTNSSFYSIDSDFDDKTLDSFQTQSNSSGEYFVQDFECMGKGAEIPKKDMWDSAYVSIDDNNSSPENNHDNTVIYETYSKQRNTPSDQSETKVQVISNMGPAEREIWQTCKELGNEASRTNDDTKTHKWDFKRPTFTPIIEESDRSLSTGLKETMGSDKVIKDDDLVTMAFSELNDIFQEYYPNSVTSSVPEMETNNNKVEYTIEQNLVSVESASEFRSDVMRQRIQNVEGEISEVQVNVTEFSSVSRALQDIKAELCNIHTQDLKHDYFSPNLKDRMECGHEYHENLVLQRKQYWDEKIRVIEEMKSQQQNRKKKLLSKHLRQNDSLTKRRGKQIVQNFLSAGEDIHLLGKQVSNETNNIRIVPHQQTCEEDQQELPSDMKLVEKWKKYWDEKLDTDIEVQETSNFKAKSRKIKDKSSHTEKPDYNATTNKGLYTVTQPSAIDDLISSTQVKQEITEEVFKAFETSPKRFFGTSRKQILNKIDAFLGKDNSTDEQSLNSENINHENGIVSSRISLFHHISQTEELPRDTLKRKRTESNAKCEKALDTVDNGNANISKDRTLQNNDLQCIILNEDINILNDNKINSLQTMQNNIMSSESIICTVEPNVDEEMTVLKNLNEITAHEPYIVSEHINLSENLHKIQFKAKERRKLSASKSEMDIFTKINAKTVDEDLDKYKSCEELPKINVKSFISLYETVTKNASVDYQQKLRKKLKPFLNNDGQQIESEITSPSLEMGGHEMQIVREYVKSYNSITNMEDRNNSLNPSSIRQIIIDKPVENKHVDQANKSMISEEILSENHSYKSINSDIYVEIIEKSPERDITKESTPEITTADYRSRFKLAQEYFQSLEELTPSIETKPEKLNECEILLQNKDSEAPNDNNKPKKRSKLKFKSNSMPSSELSKIWMQLQESEVENNEKLVKISEKFNVDDLYNDVIGEGRLSRQGSFKGIPHKKAVLETFKSMENVSDNSLSSYEITMTQLTEFAKENNIKNIQTYSTEYPYLPTTVPSKYHSRIDTKASGLISRKELLNNKPRRRSVPDLRINAFTANL